jgi:hypothetical protein
MLGCNAFIRPQFHASKPDYCKDDFRSKVANADLDRHGALIKYLQATFLCCLPRYVLIC